MFLIKIFEILDRFRPCAEILLVLLFVFGKCPVRPRNISWAEFHRALDPSTVDNHQIAFSSSALIFSSEAFTS